MADVPYHPATSTSRRLSINAGGSRQRIPAGLEQEELRTRLVETAQADFVEVTCKGCQMPWGRSRSITHRYKPEEQKPYLPDLVIPIQSSGNNMPDHLFETLQFRRRDPYGCWGTRLVTEFEYDTKSGDVYYSPAAQELTSGNYALLITQNSWYTSLTFSMVFAILHAMDIQSNLNLCSDLFSNRDLRDIAPYFRWVFVCTWGGMLFISLGVAYREASKEWRLKASTLVGDVIEEHELDAWISFACLVMLRWVLIPMHVKDIATMLHPWKATQPFAAIKMENSRAFIVGWHNEISYRVQNQAGQQFLLPIQLVSKFVNVAVKTWLAIRTDYNTLGLVVSSFATVIGLFLLLEKTYRLLKERQDFKDQLKAMIIASRSSQTPTPQTPLARSASATSEDTPGKQWTHLMTETTCQKLLSEHYEMMLGDDDKEEPITIDDWINQRVGEIHFKEGGQEEGTYRCTECSRTVHNDLGQVREEQQEDHVAESGSSGDEDLENLTESLLSRERRGVGCCPSDRNGDW